MLTFLSIRDYVLIEKLDIEFGAGFNVITGETGAGKSILVGALSLLLGGRAKADVIRTGKDKAVVQGTFVIGNSKPLLSAVRGLGIEPEEGEITVRRELNADGKNRIFINGAVCPLQTVKTLGELLVDFHGQNEHQSLLNTETHIAFLDAYAGSETLLPGYGAAYQEWLTRQAELKALLQKETVLKERREFLEHQRKELAAADLKEGRETELLSKIKVLESGRKIADLLSEARTQLDDELPLRLHKASRALTRVSEIDQRHKENAERLDALARELGEIVKDFANADNEAPDSGENLDALNARLAVLNRLKRKYACDEKGLVARLEETVRDLGFLETTSADKVSLEKAVKALEADLQKKGAELSALRKKTAGRFDRKINLLLAAMNMGEASFASRLETVSAPGPLGLDAVEFQIAANPGEPERPLSKIASGGEIARVMLAIKSVLAESDRIPVLIFDEIDTGIGGETAAKVGNLLKDLSAYHQVFCVTHSHPIAAEADRHFAVEKTVDTKHARVRMTELTRSERVAEIARMLGGKGRKQARDHAQALVEG